MIRKDTFKNFIKNVPEEFIHLSLKTGLPFGADFEYLLELIDALPESEIEKMLVEPLSRISIIEKLLEEFSSPVDKGLVAFNINVLEYCCDKAMLEDRLSLYFSYKNYHNYGLWISLIEEFFNNVYYIDGFGIDLDYRYLRDLIAGISLMLGAVVDARTKEDKYALPIDLSIKAFPLGTKAFGERVIDFPFVNY